MKKQSTTIISIVLLILIVIFALLNTESVTVNLLATQVKVPLVLLIFICLLIGALIIYLFSLSNNYKLKKELKDLQSSSKAIRNYRQQITKLEKENQQLQTKVASLSTNKEDKHDTTSL